MCAHELRIGGIEPFRHHSRIGARLLRQPGVGEKALKGLVGTACSVAAHGSDHVLVGAIAVAQMTAAETAVITDRVDRLPSAARKPLERDWRSAVDEFRAEFCRDSRAWLPDREDAAARAIPCFQNERATTAARQLRRSSKTCSAGPNHDHIKRS